MDFVIAVKCFSIFKWDFSQKMIVPGSLQNLFTGVQVCVCLGGVNISQLVYLTPHPRFLSSD